MKNLLKEKLKNGQEVSGTFVSLGHPDVTEVLSRIGFDWLLIDGEHSVIGLETMQTMMQAMNGSGCTPIVRPQWNDMVIIKRILDIGAHGVLVPWVNSREEAEYAVRACKYPPQGLRGWGPRRAALFDPDYNQTANDEILVIVQIETRQAVNNVDDILAVDGIDAVYVGSFDLSFSFGLSGPEWDNAEYLADFDRVLEAAKKAGKPAGMYASRENIRWAVEKGFTLSTVDSADAFLAYGALAALDVVKGSA
ncbi:HpcH/HpaI aldolase/citrate lyase family protein [Chloroflexota bacterium]